MFRNMPTQNYDSPTAGRLAENTLGTEIPKKTGSVFHRPQAQGNPLGPPKKSSLKGSRKEEPAPERKKRAERTFPYPLCASRPLSEQNHTTLQGMKKTYRQDLPPYS